MKVVSSPELEKETEDLNFQRFSKIPRDVGTLQSRSDIKRIGIDKRL